MTPSEVEDVALRFMTLIMGCSKPDERWPCDSSHELKEEGRFAWSTLGDLIENSPFLPITINVPDVLYGMYDMLNRVGTYFFGSQSETTPRIWQLLRELNDELPDI